MARPGLFRSVFGRVTLSALLVSLVSTLVLFLVVRQIVDNDARTMLGREVDTDLAGLADIYVSSGDDELRARIADRLAVQREDGERVWYLLADADGHPLAGNLDRWPAIAPEVSEARFVALPAGERMFARATRLAPDARLVVGRSDYRGQALLARLAMAFATAGALIALLSLVAGHFAARRLRARVEAVNATFASVRAGHIAARAPGAGNNDELAELAANTNAMLDQVERLVEAQRTVSDQTAHEIRTPLMHLDTRILKAMEATQDEMLLRTLDQSRAEIRGVVRLLDSLLDIAGTQAMRGDMRGLAEVNLSDIAESLADLYGASAEELGIGFHARIAPGVLFRADPMQMMRLMSNLLDNGFKYVPSGGTVSLELSPGPYIVVQDDGPGIPRADRHRIFERYVRLDGAPDGGHGLGLSLALAIAERHGLSLYVEDAAPGARFVVQPEDES
ncbi:MULTISPECIES: sensor histidine kinase [unclassified Sphingobium]|uniref:sensor histidine kinase n=1 Tax=unclassified Sphingobium TaxID=2611147 RepID=UPI0007F37BD3|nr:MULTISPECIES: HAMP domain-containing sensor histidine kinase [unclassified Sphingobium]OAN51190.1 histidine kinase [Sphingobium sp. TCM1]WIW87706.1 HAMP domain-containing sensor histidine kinase [Sphingobium sp. V4]